MKKIFVFAVVLAAAAAAFSQEQSVVSQAEQLFKQAEYGKGLTLLKESFSKSTSPEQKAQILMAIGNFYENSAGDFDNAVKNYSDIAKLGLSAENPLVAESQKKILQIGELEKKYSKQNAILKSVRVETIGSTDKNKIREQAVQLNLTAQQNPQYHRMTEVYYYLGLKNLALAEYKNAYDFLSKTASLKPAVNFFLPVQGQLDRARELYMSELISRISWGTLAGVLVAAALAFYISRPWRWVEWKHIEIAAAVMIVWVLLFFLSSIVLSKRNLPVDDIATQLNFEKPAFIKASPGSPGSQILNRLMLYGLCALAGVFVFAVGTAVFRKRWIAVILNVVFAVTIFASITAIFYMRYCYTKGNYFSTDKGLQYYTAGNVFYRQSEPEPLLLTDPLKYKTIKVNYFKDPLMKEWFIKQVGVISTEPVPQPAPGEPNKPVDSNK